MNITSPKVRWFVLIGIVAIGIGSVVGISAQVIPEPGATSGVELVNLSKNTSKFSSLFLAAAVSRSNPDLVAIAWRTYSLPVDTNAFRENRVAECHLSISKDGGRTFVDRNMMDVVRAYGGPRGSSPGEPYLSGCNSPWVQIGMDNTIYYGGWMLAQRSVNDPPVAGRGGGGGGNRAGVMASRDQGSTWSPMTVSIMLDRFPPELMPRAANGEPVTNPPGDGHFGAVDQQTGTLYAGTRVFGTVSEDKANTWSRIYAAKGTVAAGFGAVVGAASIETIPGKKCPCLVFSVSNDKGKTFTDTVLAEASDWSSVGTVRYPIAAVSPAQAGHYAVTAYAPDHASVKVYYTADGAKSWKSAAPGPIPANVPVTSVNQVGVGYTSDGRILLTWRGFRNPGAYNTFVAMLDGDKFGTTVKVSPELSTYPPLTYMGNYGNGNGAGDFTTWVTGNNTHAFVAFPYAPYPANGVVIGDAYAARVPLTLLK